MMKPLKEWREERELSLRALAEKSGVHFTSISEIENGNRRPHAQTASKLARALGVGMLQIEEFFDREREAIPNDEALLLASPPAQVYEPNDSGAEAMHDNMLELLGSMTKYLVRAGRGEDVARILRDAFEEVEGGQR